MDDRSWMQKRLDNGLLSQNFIQGVEGFLNFAFSHDECKDGNKIRCPCIKCKNMRFNDRDAINLHLLQKGFMYGYECWTEHGEKWNNVSQTVGEPSHLIADQESNVRTMIFEVAGHHFNFEHHLREDPGPRAQKFYNLLRDADEPLWEGYTNHTRLSAVTRLLNIKSEYNMSEACYNQIINAFHEMLPKTEKLPNDFYETKRMVRSLGLDYEKIHACKNNCMLFYKEHRDLKNCVVCGESRYKSWKPGARKGVPHKVLRYLPLTPRLRRLYMSSKTAKDMIWHAKNRCVDGSMSHPAHSEAWHHFDSNHPSFAADPRNVRLGLCTDGFNPFSMMGTPYSCWLVIITIYNLPPWMCMRREFMFLNMVIPSPKGPSNKLDVFLRPLIDELKVLWNDGVATYDCYRHQNFQMKAALLWIISDFPAYGMLSGWSTHGRLACPYCMENTSSFFLKTGGKLCWFDSHRRFLDHSHPYRKQRDKFRVDKDAIRIERRGRPPILSGSQILERLNRTFEDLSRDESVLGKGHTHNWVKMSIFWELPYWKTLLIRHNLDVMHIEKNVFDNIFNTVLDVKAKTKDNAKARIDIEYYCKRPELHMIQLPSGKILKPKSSYSLTKDQVKQLCRWTQKLKMPDGYASNIARCANDSEGKFIGMKSHDCHVFMQRLLPIALCDLLHSPIWKVLAKVSAFFRDICATVVQVGHMEQLEHNIAQIICDLEKIFPPSFFDSMEHMMIHIPYKAKIGGPVQYRWMYPYERFLHHLKKKVTNRARVEGSIVEAYLIEEVSNFCSFYFEPHVETRLNRPPRNDDGGVIENDGRLSIFLHSGRFPIIKRNNGRYLDDNEWATAHRCVLYNCEEILPFIELYSNLMRSNGIGEDEILALRDANFTTWLQDYVRNTSDNIDERVRKIVEFPTRWVQLYNEYYINGFHFQTQSHDKGKSTMNSGVCVMGTHIEGVDLDYYGITEEIMQLEFHGQGNKIVLFKC